MSEQEILRYGTKQHVVMVFLSEFLGLHPPGPRNSPQPLVKRSSNLPLQSRISHPSAPAAQSATPTLSASSLLTPTGSDYLYSCLMSSLNMCCRSSENKSPSLVALKGVWLVPGCSKRGDSCGYEGGQWSGAW